MQKVRARLRGLWWSVLQLFGNLTLQLLWWNFTCKQLQSQPDGSDHDYADIARAQVKPFLQSALARDYLRDQ